MRSKLALSVCAAVLAILTGLAPAAALPLPLPLPATGGEPLVTEGVSVEGPLVNNVTLPALK
ncbi:hypothetical protein ACIHFC_20340 [Streptomyces sp. NPDC052013]|uniref:hypothetical protein n=1 Tax=Streptomyces sp. NPDC052013 TaxID=3365679 RepID=UPI0037CF06C1